MMTWIENNMTYVLLGLAAAVAVLFILCIVLFVKFSGQKKRYDYFMGANRRPSHNLEMKIQDYYETSKRIEEKYSKLLDMVTDMDKTDKTKIQKVGLIRYNPFDEMGGNLCFALALLDGHDNGVVLNGIHSRTGSFTYAKPIEMGVSTYMLSEEEIKAVEMAKNNTYQPEHEKVVKVRFKPTFKRRDKDIAMDDQITLDQVEMMEVDEAEEKKTRTSIGDVTQAEKELILQEETLAGKIAAAELILQQREEAKKSAKKTADPEEPVFQDAVFMERPKEDETEEK
ncbi:MAG: DUF4446 family protein [Anaerotignum sp.]|nr:DUF4446 family protein [Anaerotignum sp.]MBQ7083612.1 DUF4446 family protein [Anaerotignum sp.]